MVGELKAATPSATRNVTLAAARAGEDPESSAGEAVPPPGL